MRQLYLLKFIIAAPLVMFIASCGGGDSGPSTPTLTAPTLTFPADGAINVSTLTTLNWQASRGSDVKYKVEVSSNGLFWSVLTTEAYSTSYTVSTSQELPINTRYMWRVTASNASNSLQAVSEEWSFTTASLPSPSLTSPTNNSDVVSPPTLYWNFSMPDGPSPVTFSVKISTDNVSWETKASGLTVKNYTFTEAAINTKYWWKIEASNGSFQTSSNVYSFTYTTVYTDGSVSLYKNNTLGTNPCTFIIVGDGFIREDYAVGGTFDTWVETIIDGIFSIEPYKSYKDYFRVYKVITYSNERGASVDGPRPASSSGAPAWPKQTKDTFFGCKLEPDRSTTINATMELTDIRNYIKGRVQAHFPDFTTTQFNESTILMQVNINAWAGSCQIGSGSAASLAKTALDSYGMKRNVHEGAGHGWGKLLDEYITSGSGNTSVNAGTNSRGNTLRRNRTAGDGTPWCHGGNIDLTGDRTLVHWKHYFDLPSAYGYTDVTLYEGGYTVGKDVWQSTYSGVGSKTGQWAGQTPYENIMHGSGNNFWFNAVSREAIVRRIMKVSGGTFDFNTFLTKDRAVNGNVRPADINRNYVGIDLPHDPPVSVDIHGNIVE